MVKTEFIFIYLIGSTADLLPNHSALWNLVTFCFPVPAAVGLMPFFYKLDQDNEVMRVELKHQVTSQHLPFCHIHITYFEQPPV